MADLLHSNIPSSSNFSRFSTFSFSLNLSPHPNFSFIRFAPLRRRFSQSSVLAKFSSDSSQFDIVSRTEHSDGTVSFKFGDAGDISGSVDNLVAENEAEFERESSNLDSVDDEEISDLISTFEVDNSIDLDAAKDEKKIVDDTVAICDSSVDVMIVKNEELCEVSEVISNDDRLAYGSDESSNFSVTSSTVEGSVMVVSSEDEIEKVSEVSEVSEEMSDSAKLEHGGDASSKIGETSADIEALDVVVSLEDDIEKANEVSEAPEDMSDGDELVLGGDVSYDVLETSSDIKAFDMVVSLEDEIEKVNEVSKASEEMSIADELEHGGDASSNMGETSSDIEALGRVMSLEDEIEKVNEVSEASEEMSDADELKHDLDASSSIAETSSDIGASDRVVSLEDEMEKANEVMEVSIKMIDGDKLECGGDESLDIGETSLDVEASNLVVSLEDENEDEIVEDEIEEDMVVAFEDETEKASVLVMSPSILVDEDDDSVEMMSQELEKEPILDEEMSSSLLDDGVALGSSLGFNEVVDAIFPATRQFDDGPLTSDILEETVPEAPGILLVETNQASVDVDMSTRELSVSSAAAASLLSSEVTEAGHTSIARLGDMADTCEILDGAPLVAEASGITSAETKFDSLNTEDVSLDAASLSLSSEVNGAFPPMVSHSVEDQYCSDTSLEAGLDSVPISTVANSLTPAAGSSQHPSEVDDATLGIPLSDGDHSGIYVAAVPVTSGMTSAESSLDSLKEVETSTPAFFISSAAASMADSLEALTGGKDAYFVLENWFGVADGVGQWSLAGINRGLYAHELMQNCEKLLKSTSAKVTNVKELLQQSAAMTQSIGSARVLVAHVSSQVLHVANIGDSGFVIIRNGTIFMKSSPMVHEFSFPYAIGLGDDSVDDVEEYHIELEDGDVIVIATDGLFDNLYEKEIASIVSKAVEAGMYVQCLQELAELLASKAQEVGKSESARSPFADAAQAAGHPGYSGGKFDHVTVIVSLVQKR